MAEIGYANWDLTPFFNEKCGAQFRQYLADLESGVRRLRGELDAMSQRGDLRRVQPLADALAAMEELEANFTHLVSYLECARAEDTSFEPAQSALNKADELQAEYRQAVIVVESALRSWSDEEFAALLEHPSLREVRYYLECMRRSAKFSMDQPLEELNAELEITGFKAWEHLYDTMAGRLEFVVRDSHGQERKAPMSLKMSLLEDQDPEVRRTALENSNKAWQGIAPVVSSCLNNIAGTRLKVQKRRGVPHFLDEACWDANLSRETLEAMFSAVSGHGQVARNYLRKKAELLGMERLGFQDTFVPLSLEGGEAAEQPLTWEEGCATVLRAFAAFSPEMSDFAGMALRQHWVDSQVKEGRAPGGFCTSSIPLGQSRIFITYQGHQGDVSTLAHELGHAWHEWLVRDLRPYLHFYPMTLAETASTFAEQLLSDYLLNRPGLTPLGQAEMLSRRLDEAATHLLNIPMRFYFEKAFYEARAHGEVPASALCALMRETQQKVYGEALDPQQLDEWFWASKGHFYITDISFYNFPYVFGYLFSMGVYAQAKKIGEEFVPRFKELLRMTGAASCEEVAQRSLGVDLRQPQFWLDSIAMAEADFKRFTELIGVARGH